MKHIKTLKIDIDKKNFEVIPSVQYDSNTRFLHIQLLNDSVPFDITGCSVILSGTKEDGNAIFNSCDVINSEIGFIEVEITEQMNAIPGHIDCEIKIYNGEGVLTSKKFTIKVTPTQTSRAVVSSNEFKALTDALNKAQSIDNKADKKQVEELTSQLDNIMILIVNLQNRVTALENKQDEVNEDFTLYVPNIASYGIYNDGTNSEATTNGLNRLFTDLNTNKKKNVKLPTGTYAINPNISLTPKSNLTLDLNNSTFKIDANDKNGSTMIYLKDVENLTLKNGTIEGDRYDHDYSTYNPNSTSHEFNLGVKIDQGSKNINIDNVTFTKITGYGLGIFQGTQYCNVALDKTLMESGSYDDNGNKVANSKTIRYPNKVDITEHAKYGYLQVGTLLKYQNYIFNSTRVVTVLIFDSNDKLLSKITRNMYRPINVPTNASYCYLVFNQSNPTDYLEGDMYTLDVFHMKPPSDCSITNCTFDDNRCLGIAVCGGWNTKIEGNTFSNTSKPTSDNSSPNYQHGKPGYAIDIEDGWESTHDLTINNNVFINNGYGDIVSLAGDNTVITNNQFSGRVAMYSRNTNYTVQNNTIENGIAMFETEKDYGFTVNNNTYNNTTIKAKCHKPYDDDYYSFTNETITNCQMQIDTSITLKNSTIALDGTVGSRFTGSYDTCTISNFDGRDSNSDYNTGIKLNNCNISTCNFFLTKDTIMTNNIFNKFRVRLDGGTLVFTGNEIQSNPKNETMPIVQLNGGTSATIKENTLGSAVTSSLYTNPGGITVITGFNTIRTLNIYNSL